MVATIWKYELDRDGVFLQKIRMPSIARPLSVAMQGRNLCLWAMIPSHRPEDMKLVDFPIRIVGTGHPMDFPWQSYKFLGTVLEADGALVWHVWIGE